jgi:predicted porin
MTTSGDYSMKKSLLALAVLGAFAGAAQAQTSVTIYGSFDAGLRYLDDANAAGDSVVRMSSTGTYNSNRLGFRGVEDLGGGMNAHFTLETGFNSGNGNLNVAGAAGSVPLFNRSAFVGLGGKWGSLDLGRQYSVNFKTIGAYDPFNYKFTGIIPTSVQGGINRLNNDIQYTGNFGPVTVRAEYALGEVPGDTGAGATAGLGASFKTGPFSVGAAYTTRANATDTADQKNWTVGGAFATGPFRVAAGYARDDRERGSIGATTIEGEISDAWIGGSYNITPALALSTAYYRTTSDISTAVGVARVEGDRDLFIIGATYALSKRTNFYTAIDTAKYDAAFNHAVIPGFNAPAANIDRQTGFSVGINHLF